MDVDEVRRRIWQAGGVARWSELGVDQRSVERALATGSVVKLARGVYALSAQQPALVAAGKLNGVVSHTSAAQHWMLDLVTAPVRPHVTVRRNRRLFHPEVVRHWVDLPDSDVDGRVTTPLRTVVDCARTLPFPEGLAVADSALRRGLFSADDLLARADDVRGAGRGAVQRVARHASPDAANPFESALRGIALDAGVTGLVPQRWVQVRSGLLVRPDLVDERLRMVAEADSFEWHGKRRALADDCRRYDDLVSSGWTVLRFAWEQVMFEQEWVADALREPQALCRGHTGVQKSV